MPHCASAAPARISPDTQTLRPPTEAASINAADPPRSVRMLRRVEYKTFRRRYYNIINNATMYTTYRLRDVRCTRRRSHASLTLCNTWEGANHNEA